MEARFRKLFQWQGDRLEDVRFWCEPALTAEVIRSIPERKFGEFDGIAAFEARGFFLAGAASAILGLPVVPVRKHKPFYEKMRHEKVEFTNWKGEPEAFALLLDSMPKCRRVLILDDLFDTGSSLKAGHALLTKAGMEIAGAFYLLNAGSQEALASFPFSIEAVLRHKLF
jgi:adenine phosphoribosyltransferase